MSGRTDTELMDWLASQAVIAIWTPREGGLKPADKLDHLFSNSCAPERKHEMIRLQINSAMDAEKRG